jgi:hypothetical protein
MSKAAPTLLCVVLCVLLSASAHAATILKLDAGADPASDVSFNGATLTSLVDGNLATTGDQNTAIDYLGFLSGLPDVTTPSASLSLHGLAAVSGGTTVFGGLVTQDFSGGTLEVYDAGNVLLLSGTLGTSTLSGTLGGPGTGSLFTTSLATATGGSLLPLLDVGSLSLSLTLVNINGGAGLSLTNGALDGFEADAALTVAADPAVPEPASAWLLAAGMAVLGARSRAE